MPLETGTLLSDLNAANPAHTDGLNAADAHMRLIKAVLLNTFPNINAALTVTDEQLNALAAGTPLFADGTATAPSVAFESDPTIGLYKRTAGIGISQGKNLRGNGAWGAGQFEFWPKAPPNMATGGTFTGSASLIERIEADGSTYKVSDFPDLAAFLGNDGTHFVMPLLTDTGRFLRSRTSGLTAGTSQANVFKSHTHAVTGNTGNAGAHDHGGATGNDSPDHTHGYNTALNKGLGRGGGAPTDMWGQGNSDVPSDGASTKHQHSITAAVDHAHAISLTSAATGDTGETRPEAYASVVCLHT